MKLDRRLSALSLLCALSGLGSVACGSSDEKGNGTEKIDDGEPMVEPEPPPPEPEGCGLDTAWAGDENCILPPEPTEGLQLHVGPQDYDNPDEINALGADGKPLWLMLPGDERTQCYHMTTPNDDAHYYFKQKYRMRTGSHHMIIQNSTNTDPNPSWQRCQGGIIGSIGGTQHVIEDLPPGGVVAPEDEGLARKVEPHALIDISLHFYNTTDETRMREVWVNYYYKPDDEVTTNLGMLGGFTGMNVLPGETKTVGNTCKAEQAVAESPVRIVTLFGHAHTHNKRFVVFHDKADGSSETIYDSYDGAEAPTYTYNTTVTNPAPDEVNHISGGKSGVLALNPGDQLRYECLIENNTQSTFVGRNEVNDDEMCNLFGSVAGLGFPCFQIAR